MQGLWIGASSQKVYATSWHWCLIYLSLQLVQLLRTNYVRGPVLGTQSFDLWCSRVAGTHNTHQENPPLNTTASLVANKAGESGKL